MSWTELRPLLVEHFNRDELRDLYFMRVLSMTRPAPLDEMYTDVYVLDKPSYWQRGELEALQAEFVSRGGVPGGGLGVGPGGG